MKYTNYKEYKKMKEIGESIRDGFNKGLVSHPSHYNVEGKDECWDEMVEIFGAEAVVIFDVLSAYKYYYRAGKKDGNPEAQDKAKMLNYMEHAKKVISENRRFISPYSYMTYEQMDFILKDSKESSSEKKEENFLTPEQQEEYEKYTTPLQKLVDDEWEIMENNGWKLLFKHKDGRRVSLSRDIVTGNAWLSECDVDGHLKEGIVDMDTKRLMYQVYKEICKDE